MLKKEVILEGLVKGRDKMEEHNNVINKIQKKRFFTYFWGIPNHT